MTDNGLAVLTERAQALRIQAQRCDAARERLDELKQAASEARRELEAELEALVDMSRGFGPLFNGGDDDD